MFLLLILTARIDHVISKKEAGMSKIEAIEIFAKSVFNEEKKVVSTDEFNALVEKAETQQERDFYLYIYSYLLQRSQKEVVQNGKY